MTRCACGARVPGGAGWCSLCHQPVGDARFAPVVDAEAAVTRDRGRATSVAEEVRRRGRPVHGRFAATEVTFGPAGRLVMTVLVLLPPWFFVAHLATGGWVGVVVLALVGLPWALRDIWRRSDRL